MADLITIKGGSGDVPTLLDRELAYRKDEKALYIGVGGDKVRLCGAEDVAKIIALTTKVNELTATINELTAQISVLQGQINTINANIQNITARLDALTPGG